MAAVPISSGSFGANSGGGGSPLSQALQRRGLDEGILNQVTGGAPTSPERGLPQPVGANPPSAVPAPQGLPTSGPGSLPPSDTTTIIKALDSKMKSLSKIEESRAGIQVSNLININNMLLLYQYDRSCFNYIFLSIFYEIFVYILDNTFRDNLLFSNLYIL